MTEKERKQAELVCAKDTESQNLTVYRHNSMNNYIIPDLNLNDYRFLSFYLARIDIRAENHDEQKRKNPLEIVVPASEFTETFGINIRRISMLDKELQKLKEKMNIRILPENSNHSVALFYAAHFEKDEVHNTWTLYMFGTNALPYYFRLNEGNYTQYKLSSVVAFNSKFQYILYNLLRQYTYRPSGELVMTYDQLLTQMGFAYGQYKDWEKYKERIMRPSQDVICNFSDIVFSFEKRKGTNLILFIIRKKDDGYCFETQKNGRIIVIGPDKENLAELDMPENRAIIRHYSEILGIEPKNSDEKRRLLEWNEKQYSDEDISSAKEECLNRRGFVIIPYVNGILNNRKKQCMLPAASSNVEKNHAIPSHEQKRAMEQMKKLKEELQDSSQENE